MPITESRLKGGLLTIDGKQFATQATNVSLKPDVDEDGDALEALSGDEILPDEVTSWSLEITAVQDFDEPAGFVRFAMANAGEVVAFVWKPNADGVQFSGTVKVRAVTVGGEVNKRLTTPASWPLQGSPVPSDA